MFGFSDETYIDVASGNGGHGCVSFRREKFVPKGGPDGGDGGRGGDVVFVVRSNLRTLGHLKLQRSFRAENGRPGQGARCAGRNGKDVEIPVPPGTVIRDAQTGELIKDLTDTDRYVFLKGGKGGLGNWHFRNAVRQAPKYAQPGFPGEEMRVGLELQIIADIGLVGFPNAGKSSLINLFTNARSKVAGYPFTTKIPVLGVLRDGDQDVIIADIPGIIEGASEGAGLGHLFLRHLSRTSLLLHIIDCAPLDPDTDSVAEARALVAELAKYDDELAEKTRWVVLNKIDLVPEDEREELIARFKAELGADRPLFVMSAATREGCETLIKAIAQELDTKRREAQQIEEQRDDVRFAETHEVEL